MLIGCGRPVEATASPEDGENDRLAKDGVTSGPHALAGRIVQELRGHRDRKRVMRYAHLSPAHKAAVAKLEAALTPSLEPAAIAVGGEEPGQTQVSLERFRNAPSGRQAAAKREYVESRRLGEWRRGESNRAGREGVGGRSRFPTHMRAVHVPATTVVSPRFVPQGRSPLRFRDGDAGTPRSAPARSGRRRESLDTGATSRPAGSRGRRSGSRNSASHRTPMPRFSKAGALRPSASNVGSRSVPDYGAPDLGSERSTSMSRKT